MSTPGSASHGARRRQSTPIRDLRALRHPNEPHSGPRRALRTVGVPWDTLRIGSPWRLVAADWENCPNVIVVHNHPSGDPTPSPEDTSVTRRIRESAELLDIALLDHVVIGARGFVSMKQRGLGFDGSGGL